MPAIGFFLWKIPVFDGVIGSVFLVVFVKPCGNILIYTEFTDTMTDYSLSRYSPRCCDEEKEFAWKFLSFWVHSFVCMT